MIIKLFLFWRIALLLFTYFGTLILPKIQNGAFGAQSQFSKFNYWESLAQWDGGHFINIAKFGYTNSSDFAFFPLFPFLIKIVAIILNNNYLIAGLLISNISFLLFLLLFYKLIQENYSKQTAIDSIITLLVFPTTFFAVSYYSESVFMLFAVTTFWAISKKNYFLAGIFASFSYLSRFIGITLIISIFYNYFYHFKYNLNKNFLFLTSSIFGIIAYFVFSAFGNFNPLQFLWAQTYWQREISDPVSLLLSYLWAFITQIRPINDYFDFLVVVIFIIILILGRRKITSSVWIFSMLALLIPMSTGTLSSIPRYAIVSFGVYIIVGNFIQYKPRLKIIIWTILLALQGFLATHFLLGNWVA